VDELAANEASRDFALRYLLAKRDEDSVAAFLAANGFEQALEALCALAQGRGGLLGALDEASSIEAQNEALRRELLSLHDAIVELFLAGRGLDAKDKAGSGAWIAAAEEYLEQELPAWTMPHAGADAEAAYRAWAERSGGCRPHGKNPQAHG
jgi:hypothetical protein